MKRLVICADGTWNVQDQVDEKTGKRRPTNVTKVARAILPCTDQGIHQVVIYHEGVGTDGGLDKFTGGAFGHGIEENVRDLYRAIVYNYHEGDDLFFFGFSRGAFTVRTLIGFMNHVGLIRKDDDYYLPEMYACYEKGHRPGSAEWTRAFHNVRQQRACPPIMFAGVWDTVGALGAPGLLGRFFNRDKYKYHDIELNAHVLHAYHALAIDEHRKPFAPSVWKRPPGWTGELVQAWFPGVHCNVGGGLWPDGLANEALHWMVGNAERLGLAVDSGYLSKFLPCYNSTKHESMSAKYKLLGTNLRPVCSSPTDGEVLHQATVDRWNDASCAYKGSENLARVLSPTPPTVGVVNTTRVSRGTPCPPI